MARHEDSTPVMIPADTDLNTVLDGTFVTDAALLDGSLDAVFNTVGATTNGTGTNFKVGDDAYIGDVNVTNTLAISGVVDRAQGFIQFGTGSLHPSIGFNNNGAFPAIGTAQAVTGSILIKSAHLYFFNGTSSNNGWAQVI